jgi:hypothetical protein
MLSAGGFNDHCFGSGHGDGVNVTDSTPRRAKNREFPPENTAPKAQERVHLLISIEAAKSTQCIAIQVIIRTNDENYPE